MSAAETATEVVADVAEEVAEVAHASSGRGIGLAVGGFVVGAGLGAVGGYIFAQRRLEVKYADIAAAEVAEMREHYHAKEVARENAEEKGELEDIVRARGYVPGEEDEIHEEDPEQAATPPMAVTPPSGVVDRAQEIAEAEDEAAGEPPDVAEDDEVPVVRNVFRDRTPPVEEWDEHKERAQRSPMRPYVIHRDEREEHDAYDAVTYTWYEADDVVCNERDEIISPEDRERIIGEANLEKFGHGSDDPNVVYVRNDELQMDMEVIRSPNSYAEEVHGLEPEIKHSDRRRGRASFDDGD